MHRYLRRVRVSWPVIVSRHPNTLMREADVYVLLVVRLQRPTPPTERLVCVKIRAAFRFVLHRRRAAFDCFAPRLRE